MERVMGIGPTPSAWKAEVLPLNYTRDNTDPWDSVFSTLWWRGKDSNLRRQSRQIYSLIPLTAREPLLQYERRILLKRQVLVNTYTFKSHRKRNLLSKHIQLRAFDLKNWSWRLDLNPRPADYKSAALPTELRQPTNYNIVLTRTSGSILQRCL